MITWYGFTDTSTSPELVYDVTIDTSLRAMATDATGWHFRISAAGARALSTSYQRGMCSGAKRTN